MQHKTAISKYTSLIISISVSFLFIVAGLYLIHDLNMHKVVSRLLLPLIRLICSIGLGLVAGQIIETMGWTKFLASFAGPLFKFGNLGQLCSSTFTTAFFSGITSNTMLLNFYMDGKISQRQLYLTNLINQLPAYFLHLPTTFFIVVPLTGMAGILYFIITLAATLFRTAIFLFYGHIAIKKAEDKTQHSDANEQNTQTTIQSSSFSLQHFKIVWKEITKKFPSRMLSITVFVVPVYIFIFILTTTGFFDWAQKWLTHHVTAAFLPVEALSIVVLGFVAEFSSGFTSAGALRDAGILTTKQTVLALLIGNIIAFPIRTLRHQLPRYMGIFSPKMGAEILLIGQGSRIMSLLVMGILFYYLG